MKLFSLSKSFVSIKKKFKIIFFKIYPSITSNSDPSTSSEKNLLFFGAFASSNILVKVLPVDTKRILFHHLS